MVLAPRQRHGQRTRTFAAAVGNPATWHIAGGGCRLCRLRTLASAACRRAVVFDSFDLTGAAVRAGQVHTEELSRGVGLLLATDRAEEGPATDSGACAA